MSAENAKNVEFYSNIASKKVEWLWYPYIPYGKITIIQGDPGEGKTSLALFLASVLSVGGLLPLEEKPLSVQNVIYQNNEDGASDTIKPRLENYGADCSKICFMLEKDKAISLMDDRLEKAIIEAEARMLILDPIQAFLGDSDMVRANDIRPIMSNLCRVAERTGCAIILVGHLNKNEGGKALYRGLGSIDIAAAARSILMVSKPNEDEDKVRKIAQVKSNLAPTGKPLLFSLIRNRLMDWRTAEYDEEPAITITRLAEKKLREIVGENGISGKDAFERMGEQGFSKRTVERAKSNIGVKSRKEGIHWIWVLGE